MRKRRGRPVHGWVIVDKPVGVTSTQAVGMVRRAFDAQKAGHGGTLDPLASGLLPVALGEATKTMSWALEGKKRYRFTVRWGEERLTDDLEGDITDRSDLRPSIKSIESILSKFTGVIDQTPPAFSAIKVDGERAYDLARSGEEVALQPRKVRVESLSLTGVPDIDHAEFDVCCGKGTYVRALARDMGRALGCLGHVVALRRTGVGPFSETQMIPLEKLMEIGHKPGGDDAISGALRPIETVLDGIPALAVDGMQAQRLRQGQPVLLRGANAPIASDAVFVTSGGKPLGIGCIEQGTLKPKRLFNL